MSAGGSTGRDRPTDRDREAAAYLSRVVQGPSRSVNDLVAQLGYSAAANAVRAGDVPPAVRERVAARAHVDRAAEDLDEVRRLGGRFVLPTDDEWPSWRLLALSGPEFTSRADRAAPLGLWVLGSRRLDELTDKAVAVVGTRDSSPYGDHVAGEISGDMAADGWTVVSGAAFGIDGAAHRAALGVGGLTVAVLACGVDRAYPAGHRRLLGRIAESGVVISEYAPGTTPAKHRFLARNRLVATLGSGVVVVEAGWRSGARNTAGWARAAGRPVVAVPGPVNSPRSMGCHRMIREGEAVLVSSARDVVAEIGPVSADDDGLDHLFALRTDELPERARIILDALASTGSSSPVELSERSGIVVSDVRSLLVQLEMDGLVGRDTTGWFRVSTPRR